MLLKNMCFLYTKGHMLLLETELKENSSNLVCRKFLCAYDL
jgi:hypothetical protein